MVTEIKKGFLYFCNSDIIRQGELIFSGGAGYASIENDRLIDNNGINTIVAKKHLEIFDLIETNINKANKMVKEIKKGHTYLCDKDIYVDGIAIFRARKVYESESGGCLISENGYQSLISKENLQDFTLIEKNKMIKEIKKGHTYLCDKDILHKDIPIFKRGEIYYCSSDGKLTGEDKVPYTISDISLKIFFPVEENDQAPSLHPFQELTMNMYETYKRKNHDYGDSFNNSLDKFGPVAAVVRMFDKMERIQTLSQKEALVKDEGIRDSLLDLANYSLMTVMWLDKQKGKEE